MIDEPVGDELMSATSALSEALESVNIESEQALDALGYVRVTARLDEAVSIGRLHIPEGTRLAFRISNWEMGISADPGMSWALDWWPDATINGLNLDFRTGEFTARAEGLGPDGVYIDATTSAAAEHLGPYLPEAMREPGYRPSADPQLQQNLQLLFDRLMGRSEGASETTGLTQLQGVSAPTLNLSFTIDEAKQIPIPNSDRSIWVDPGTHVDVNISTDGPLDEPELRSLRVSFRQPVTVAGDPDAMMASLELRALTLRPGAELTLDYELGAEQTIDGVRGAIVLLALLAEPSAAHNLPPMERTRMEQTRARIQTQIDQRLEPRLIQVLEGLDQRVPGISVLDFFGIPHQGQTPQGS